MFTQSFGFDVIKIGSSSSDLLPHTHFALVKTNVDSYTERKQRGSEAESHYAAHVLQAAAASPTFSVRPLNASAKEPSMVTTFFGASSSSSSSSSSSGARKHRATTHQLSAAAVAYAEESPEVEGKSSHGDESGSEVEEDEDDDSDIAAAERATSGAESMDERLSSNDRTRNSSDARTSLRRSEGGGGGGAPSVAGSTAVPQKQSIMSSLFSFSGSASTAAAAAAAAPQKITQDQLLALPALALASLMDLLKFIHASELFEIPSNSTSSSSSSSAHIPGSTSTPDCLSAQETVALNSVTKYIHPSNVTPATASINPANLASANGLWLSQWRLRKAVTSTTAFQELTALLASLKKLNVREIRKLSNDEKLCFWVNLYNLMSLHASLLIPWPRLGDTASRMHWLKNARYEVGPATISLLQVEFGILRSTLTCLDLPSMPSTEVTDTPNILCLFVCPLRFFAVDIIKLQLYHLFLFFLANFFSACFRNFLDRFLCRIQLT